MIAMDQYLLQILKETKTIIIPHLGALTITNATTGELMFMPFLKHDDGKLSTYIAKKEGIEENEAKNIIAKYVREINTTVDKGNSYNMFQFGTFTKGADGDVEFENWNGENTESRKTAFEVVEEPNVEIPEPKKEKAPEVEEIIPEIPNTKNPEPKVEEVIPELPKAEIPEPKVEKPVVEIKKEIPKVEVKPKIEEISTPPLVSVVTGTSLPKKEMNIAEKEELSKSVEKLEKLKKDKENGKKKKQRGVGFYMLMVLIALIIAGGTYFAMNYDELRQHVPFLADVKEKKDEKKPIDEMKKSIGKEEIEEPQENTEVVEENNEVVEEPIEEIISQPVIKKSTISSDGGSFHIVAGAFSSSENANRLVQKLKDAGYPATTIERGSQTVVSVKSFATRAEAQAAVSTVQDVAPKGWVLEWNN